MAELKEARVPDIGDFDDVPVIEVLVAPGDTVEKDQGLVLLESDKATMEVPSPFAGVVREVKVSVDDKVAEGALVATIETGGDAGGEGDAREDDAKADDGAKAGKDGDAGNGGDASAGSRQPGRTGERAEPEGQAPAAKEDDPAVEPASPGSRPDNIA